MVSSQSQISQAAAAAGPMSSTRSTSITISRRPSSRCIPLEIRASPGSRLIGIGLAIRFREPQHLADVVDHQAVGLAARFHADRHRGRAFRARRHAEAAAEIDQGHDAAAQVEHARDLGRRERNASEPSGTKTSCTGKIGRPNSSPPTTAVTYSLSFRSVMPLVQIPSAL